MRAPLLSGRVPWALPGSSADLFFSKNGGVAAIGGRAIGLGGLSSLLSTSRAQTVSSYAQWADGHLSAFTANTPRITDQGLLVEQASTNLRIHSQDTSGWGSTTNASQTNNAIVAPDGTLTGMLGTATAGGGFLQSNYSTAGNTTTYTDSVWIKYGTGASFSSINVSNTAAGSTGGTNTTITWSNGVPTIAGVTIVPASNGWYRIIPAAITPGATNGTAFFKLVFTNNGDTGYVWGLQSEQLTFATSYIPTTTVSVTRAADNITAAGALLTAITKSKAARAITNQVNSSSGSGAIVGFNTAGAILYWNATPPTHPQIYAGTGSPVVSTLGSGSASGLVKIAFDYDGNGLGILANGGTKATSAQAWPSITGTINIGSGGGAGSLNGYLLRMTFGPVKGAFDLTTIGSNPQ